MTTTKTTRTGIAFTESDLELLRALQAKLEPRLGKVGYTAVLRWLLRNVPDEK